MYNCVEHSEKGYMKIIRLIKRWYVIVPLIVLTVFLAAYALIIKYAPETSCGKRSGLTEYGGDVFWLIQPKKYNKGNLVIYYNWGWRKSNFSGFRWYGSRFQRGKIVACCNDKIELSEDLLSVNGEKMAGCISLGSFEMLDISAENRKDSFILGNKQYILKESTDYNSFLFIPGDYIHSRILFKIGRNSAKAKEYESRIY